MRLAVALHCRSTPPEKPLFPFPGSQGHIQPTNARYAPFIADCLDRLEQAHGELKEAALAWGLSATALARIFFGDRAVLETVQKIRHQLGKPLLRKPG